MNRFRDGDHYWSMFAILFVVAMESAGCDELCSRQAFLYYGLLLAASHFGADVEHGAFLFRQSNGSVGMLVWPPGGGQRESASYSGRIPVGCVGVVHTHPPRQKNPSERDRAEAVRLRLAVVVITREAVTVAWPDGTMGTLGSNEWTRTANREKR